MKPIHLNLAVALLAAAAGAVMTLGINHARGGEPAATKPFTMPASLPAVREPPAITAQRTALENRVGGRPSVYSTVFDVAKLTARSSGVGTRRDLCDGPTVTLNELEMHISTLNPNEMSHAPHQHLNEEVVTMIEGTLEVTINGKAYTAHKGDVMFFAANDWHNVRNIGTEPALYYIVNWSAPLKPTPSAAASGTPAPK
jgi:quercetin dioxygenase-like cupin family protein